MFYRYVTWYMVVNLFVFHSPSIFQLFVWPSGEQIEIFTSERNKANLVKTSMASCWLWPAYSHPWPRNWIYEIHIHIHMYWINRFHSTTFFYFPLYFRPSIIMLLRFLSFSPLSLNCNGQLPTLSNSIYFNLSDSRRKKKENCRKKNKMVATETIVLHLSQPILSERSNSKKKTCELVKSSIKWTFRRRKREREKVRIKHRTSS